MRRLATLLLLVALSGCSADDPAAVRSPGPAAPSSASPLASPSRTSLAAPTPAASPQTTRSPAPNSEKAVSTVRALLEALGADMPRAWALLSVRAQDSFGSQATFQEYESEYAEGLAAFGDLPATTARIGEDAVVVVLAGQVSREGETDEDAVALPLRVERGQWRVELLSSASSLGIVDVAAPQAGTTVPTGSRLRALVPAAARTVVLLDGAAQRFTTTPKDGDRTEVSLAPDLAPGDHLLLVAATRADGLLLAGAVPFTVR